MSQSTPHAPPPAFPAMGSRKGLVRMLLAAAAYVMVEEATLRLTVSPAYSVAIWPAAGLALGLMLVWGRGIWPGLFVGAYLGDLLHGTEGMSSNALVLHALVSVLNTSGTVAQAALGATLTRRLIEGRAPLSLYRHVTRFFLLGGPVSCLVGSSAGVLARYWDGRLPLDTMANFWLTWWSGDCIGVILFAPIVLMALPESRPAWRDRALQVAVPLIGMAAAVVVGGVWVNRSQEMAIHQRLDREADAIDERLNIDLVERMEALRLLSAFFGASEVVTQEEFKSFARVDARKPGIQALLWAPLVLQSDRAAFEQSNRNEKGESSPITEISFDGSFLPDRLRPEYVPVQFVEPVQAIPEPIGFNLGSDSACSEAMARACDTDAPCAARAPFLVGGKRAVLVSTAVYQNGFDPAPASRAQRRENLRGFTVGVLKLDQIIGSFVKNIENHGLAYRVWEEGTSYQRQILMESGLIAGSGDFLRSLPVEVAGLRWSVELAPVGSVWLPGQMWNKGFFLMGSVLLSLLSGIFVLAAAGQGGAIAREVAERTSDLEAEIATRRAVEADLRASESRSLELNAMLENLVQERTSELAASKDVFQSVADLSPSGIFRTNAEGHLVYTNQRLLQICGLGDDARGALDWASLIHPDDLPPVSEQWEAARRDHGPFHAVLRVRRPGRVVFWVTVQAVPITEPDGQPGGLVGTVTDVTHQRQTELALRILSTELAGLSGEPFFAALAAKVSDLLCVDLAVVTHLQAGPPPLLQTIAMVMDGMPQPPQSYSMDEAPCARVPAAACSPSARKACRLFPRFAFSGPTDGQACAGVPLTDTLGKMLGHLSVRSRLPFDDPSHIESILRLFAVSAGAELERMRREKQFTDLFEFAPDATVMTGQDGSIRLANRQAERLFGLERADLVGRPLSTLVPDAPRGQQFALRHDGTRLPVEINTGLIESAAGTLQATSIRDISERVETEKRLRQVQRMESLGTLAGGIAHDLNNTLAPILMGAELLRMESPSEGAPFLDVIETSARRGADMVRQLLAFAKGSEGERVLLDMRKILREIELIVRSTFPKAIRLETQYADSMVPVLGDPTQMQQVLLNLCVNARDAMPAGGTLRIEAESRGFDEPPAGYGARPQAGVFFVLRVRDTGSGIAPETLDRIFDPFFTTKGPQGGTGLGLSTVLGIVKSHGGVLQVHSAPGQGTTFEVFLPMGRAVVPAREEEPETDFCGNGDVVLVVDDEASIRFMLKPALEMMRFEVATAGNGAEAMALIREFPGRVRLALIDLSMPVMDGVSLARELRAADPTLSILPMTGLKDETRMAQLRQFGITRTLAKPFGLAELVAALKALRDESDGQDAGLLLDGAEHGPS